MGSENLRVRALHLLLSKCLEVGNTKQETYYDFINKCIQWCFAVDRVLFSKQHIRISYISSRSRLPNSQLSHFIFHCSSLDTSSRMSAERSWTSGSDKGNTREHFIHKVVQCYAKHQRRCHRMCYQVQFHRLWTILWTDCQCTTWSAAVEIKTSSSTM